MKNSGYLIANGRILGHIVTLIYQEIKNINKQLERDNKINTPSHKAVFAMVLLMSRMYTSLLVVSFTTSEKVE